MDITGLSPPSSPELNTNTQHEIQPILGRSKPQNGKKRKDDAEHAGDFKKRKQVKSIDKEISELNNIITNQEILMDKLLLQLTLGSEGLELELLKDKLAMLCPYPNWNAWMPERKNPFDSNLVLKHRSGMLDRQIQLLHEMVFL